jgi:hypothetical protein
LSPDRTRIGDANNGRSHNGRYRGNRQDRIHCVIQSVCRAIAHSRFDSSLQITSRHPRYASERQSQIQLADLEDAFGVCARLAAVSQHLFITGPFALFHQACS